MSEPFLVLVRKLPPLEHPGEAVEHRQVGAFLLAARSVLGPQSFTGKHGNGLAIAAYRHGREVHRSLRTNLDRAIHGALGLECLDDQRPASGLEHLADEIGPIQGGPGGGSNVAQQDQRSVRSTRVPGIEDEVGERQVGQEAPHADQILEMGDSDLVEVRMGPGQLGEGRHRPAAPRPLRVVSPAVVQPKPTGLCPPSAPMST